MAEKRTINIDINNNADETAKDFDTLNKSIDQTTKSTKNLDATFEEVYGDLQPLTSRMGEAEDRLYELSLAGDTTSKEFQELLTKVGQYRKVQIQTDIAVDGAAKTMTEKLGSALTGATSGFALAQGSMALFGSENEALEKSLLKVQGAMAIQQGVKGLTDSWKELALGTKIATAAQSMFTFVTGASTVGLKLFRLALISTGIGVAVVALGMLIANFDKVLGAMKPVIQAFKDFGDAIGLSNFAEEDRNKARDKRFDAEKKRHKQTMANAAKEIEAINKLVSAEKKRQGEIEATYALQLRQAKGNSKEIEKINEELTQSKKVSLDEEERLFRESKLAQIKQEEAGVKVFETIVAKNQAKGRSDHAKELAEITKRSEKISKLKAQFLDNDYTEIESFNVRRDNLDIDYDEGVDARRKARNDKYRQHLLERLSIARQIQDLENSILDEGIDKELEISRIKFERLIADVKGTAKEKKRLTELYLFQQQEAEDEIRNKFRQESLEKESQFFEDNKLPLMKVQADKEVEIEVYKYAEFAKIQQAAFEKEKKERKILQDAKIDIAVQGLQLIAGIADAFAGDDVKRQKKAFQIKKVADIAAATVDGYRAVLSTYAQTPGGIVLKTIAATIAGGFAALQIGNIASAEFGGGGGDVESSASAGGGEVSAPSFNVVGDSGINQLASLQQQPVQAFVVSGEVTTSQALDRNRVENATL